MDKCVYCGSETVLYEGAMPICIECSDRKDAGEKLIPRARKTHLGKPEMNGGMSCMAGRA